MGQSQPLDQTATQRPNQRRKTLKSDVQLTKGGPTATAIARLLVDQSLNYGEIAKRVCVRACLELTHRAGPWLRSPAGCAVMGIGSPIVASFTADGSTEPLTGSPVPL